MVKDYFDVTYSDNTTGTVNFNKKESYVIPLDQEAPMRLVLRFGSPQEETNTNTTENNSNTTENSSNTTKNNTMTFTGEVKGIQLHSTDLPSNTVTKETDKDSYQLTETLYLTKSGLVAQVNPAVKNPYN